MLSLPVSTQFVGRLGIVDYNISEWNEERLDDGSTSKGGGGFQINNIIYRNITVTDSVATAGSLVLDNIHIDSKERWACTDASRI